MDAESVVIEFSKNDKLRIDLTARSKNTVTVETGRYQFPELEDKNYYSRLVVRPGACNVVAISLERRKGRVIG